MVDSIWSDVKGTFNQQKTVVPKLILANIIAFIVLNGGHFNFTYLICYATGFDFSKVLHFFSLPIQIEELAWKPWTLLTYGFLHEGFWHILFNMIFLYVFGNILEEYLGSKKIITAFFVGIVLSAIIETLAFQLLRFTIHSYPYGYTIGASGAIMAIMAASATLLPDFELRVIIFNIKLKYIFLFYFLLDLFSLTDGVNWGGHIAHLGGAIFGYLYIKDIYRNSYIDNFFDNITGLFKPKPRMKVVYKSTNPPNRNQQSSYKSNSQKPNQQEIDEILDKISQSGYDSLTKSEKEILFAASHDE